MRLRIWDSLPEAKFYKNHLTGYTAFGQIYTKNYQAHTLKVTMMKFGTRCGPEIPSRMPNFIFKNRLRGYTPLGKVIPKITNFGDFGARKPTFLKRQP